MADPQTASRVPDLSLKAVMTRVRTGVLQMTLNHAVAGITPLCLIPLYLRAWGPGGYGHWVSLTALVSYVTLLDLGGQTFFGNLMAREFSRGDDSGLRRRLCEGVSLFVLISAASLCVLALLVCWPLSSPGRHMLYWNTSDRCVLLFMGSTFLLAIPGGVYAAAYRSTGLFSRGVLVGNVIRPITTAFSIGLLLEGVGQGVFSVTYFISNMIGTAVIVADTRRQIPACRHVRISLAAARAGFGNLAGALHFWLLALANGLNQQGVILVLAALAGRTSVSVYASHRAMAGLVGYAGTVLQGPLWPELTFVHARNDHAGMRSISQAAVQLVLFVSAILAVVLWAGAPFIYRSWTGNRLLFDPWLFALCLAQPVLAAGWSTSAWVLTATNRHQGLAYWAVANGAVTIALAFWLVPLKGTLGAAIANLSGDLFCGAVVYPVLASRYLLIRVREVCMWLLRPLALAFAAGLIIVAGGAVASGWTLVILRVGIGLVSAYLGTQFILRRGQRTWSEMAAAEALPAGAAGQP